MYVCQPGLDKLILHLIACFCIAKWVQLVQQQVATLGASSSPDNMTRLCCSHVSSASGQAWKQGQMDFTGKLTCRFCLFMCCQPRTSRRHLQTAKACRHTPTVTWS